MPDLVVDLLKPARLTAVVDIGANPIDGEPPYKPMLQNRLCRLTGFEPQDDARSQNSSVRRATSRPTCRTPSAMAGLTRSGSAGATA